MSDKVAMAFRATCRSGSGLTVHKDFADRASAEEWARANVQNFERIIVEAREPNGWKVMATFPKRP